MQNGFIRSQPNTDAEKKEIEILLNYLKGQKTYHYGNKINLNNKDILKYSEVVLV